MGFSCKSKTVVAVRNSTQDPGRNNSGSLESFRFKDLEAATSAFARENLILKASYGYMYWARLQDGRVVAVKRPDTGKGLHEDGDAFNSEVQILSKLFSRRLVNLLGCSYDGRVTLVVLEYMENGTLHENLVEPVAGMRGSSTAVSLSWPVRVKLALDIAKAIRALHASSPPIVHRNIRTTNVFIDRDGNARLGDFCLAKCMQEVEPPLRSVLISIPEIGRESETDPGHHSGRHSVGLEDLESYEENSSSSSASDPRINPKTDVFSFGVILLEIMSGRTAADADHHVGTLRLLDWALPLIKHGHFMALCDPTITPFPDTAAVRLIANVAARCVRSSTVRRPSMEEVVQCLTKASKLIPEPNPTTPSSSRDHHPIPGTPTMSSRLITTTPTLNPTPSAKLNVRSSLWRGFTNLKKKRTLVFRLTRFLARKFRIGGSRRSSSYNKLPRQNSNHKGGSTPLKGSKVSDEDLNHSRSVMEQVFQQKRSVLANGREHKIRRVPAGSYSPRFAGTSSHRSGEKFVRLT